MASYLRSARLAGSWGPRLEYILTNAVRAQIVWPHFWAIQIILAVLILNYCVMHELARVIGPKRMRRCFSDDLLMLRHEQGFVERRSATSGRTVRIGIPTYHRHLRRSGPQPPRMGNVLPYRG